MKRNVIVFILVFILVPTFFYLQKEQVKPPVVNGKYVPKPSYVPMPEEHQEGKTPENKIDEIDNTNKVPIPEVNSVQGNFPKGTVLRPRRGFLLNTGKLTSFRNHDSTLSLDFFYKESSKQRLLLAGHKLTVYAESNNPKTVFVQTSEGVTFNITILRPNGNVTSEDFNLFFRVTRPEPELVK